MKYPIGIQSFKVLREDGFCYVDKTALVYKLASEGKYYFLSRPRRFGKSLLLSTMKAYFLGQRELFDGLALAELEHDWKQYAVLHIDLNAERYSTPEALNMMLNRHLVEWEEIYGKPESEDTISGRFQRVITHAARQSEAGKAVVLVDEYDKPLLEAIGKPELQEEYRQTLKAFYSNIKSCGEHIHFAFLTGVTKFSHLSIFSGLNNLNDISLDNNYASICGITPNELTANFAEGIAPFATKLNTTPDELIGLLKKKYDGYHFSHNVEVGIYNPFSLLNAMSKQRLDSFWFATGTPNFLVEVLKQLDYPLDRLTTDEVERQTIDSVDVMFHDPIPLLFQSGYLTIKNYNARFDAYKLDFPNEEVEQGFAQFMTAYYHSGTTGSNFVIRNFVQEVERGDVEAFMRRLQAFFADGDYQLVGQLEIYFQNSLQMLFKLMGFYVQVERHTSKGRMDITIQTHDYIYVMELKIDRPATEALQQIDERGYAKPFATDPRQLFKVGVNFSSEHRGIADWEISTR